VQFLRALIKRTLFTLLLVQCDDILSALCDSFVLRFLPFGMDKFLRQNAI